MTFIGCSVARLRENRYARRVVGAAVEGGGDSKIRMKFARAEISHAE